MIATRMAWKRGGGSGHRVRFFSQRFFRAALRHLVGPLNRVFGVGPSGIAARFFMLRRQSFSHSPSYLLKLLENVKHLASGIHFLAR